MNLCGQINSELHEALNTKNGLSAIVKSFSARLKQLLVKHKLIVTNYDLDRVCKDLILGRLPSKSTKQRMVINKAEWREIEKISEGIELTGSDIFKGDEEIPRQFKSDFAKSFNAFASIILNADNTLFSNVSKKEYLRHFLQIEVELEKEQ